jgi:hypothetical protein
MKNGLLEGRKEKEEYSTLAVGTTTSGRRPKTISFCVVVAVTYLSSSSL